MICLSAKLVTRDDGPVVRIDAGVPEKELYGEGAGTLEGVRNILQSGRLPRKQFHLPDTPFLVAFAGEPRELVVESVDAWDGDVPGARFLFFSRDIPDDLDRLTGKTLEARPLPVGGKEALPRLQNK